MPGTGKEKRRKITFKKGGKGLKNASFWVINSTKKISKEGGGNDQNAQYIFPVLILMIYFIYL